MQTLLVEPRDALRAAGDLDLPLGDERAASDVDVVSTAAGHVGAGDTGTVDTVVEGKAGFLETGEQGGFGFSDLLGEGDGEGELDGEGQGFVDEVGFFGGGSLSSFS